METDTADYTPYRWHDNLIRGLDLEVGDADAGDWRSNLVLDIDHIVSWECAAPGPARFRVAPATLIFHDATDLRLAIDFGDSGGQTALQCPSIDRIERTRVADQKVCLDRPYWRWVIALNWPQGGSIDLAASGFTLSLRGAPLLLDQPWLPAAARVPRGASR